MASISFWIKRFLFLLALNLVWCVLAVFYYGKRKKLPPIKNPLLLKSATKLAEDIRKGKLKSEALVQVYIDRIREVQPYINAVVEDCFQDALDQAREADALVESGLFTEQQLAEDKPLLGVPLSVKILLSVKGVRNTCASLFHKDRIGDEDAETVVLMKKAGAIVLVITNAAEFGGAFESDNLLYGKTSNPYDTTKTAGGSSGGEGALLSAGGSVIGLANDCMGSIRIPAHYCGLFSHKSTIGRVSNHGCNPTPHPSMVFMLYTGPMCRYSEDLITMMKILSTDIGGRFKPLPSVNFKDLKIYYQKEIIHPFLTPLDKDIAQAIANAASHFTENYGAVSQEVNIPKIVESFPMSVYLLHGHVPNNLDYITNGKFHSFSTPLAFMKCLFRKSIFTLETVIGFCLLKKPIFFNQDKLPYYEELNETFKEVFDKLLDENSVFIIPTMPNTALYHKESLLVVASAVYLGVFNCTGLPVTQCPMGLSKKGMPVGIQIIGKKNNDALTIAVAAELEKAFGGWIPPVAVEIHEKDS